MSRHAKRVPLKYNHPVNSLTSPPAESEGWQLWDSERPLTPVFDSPEGLAEFCYLTQVPSFARFVQTYQEWMVILTAERWTQDLNTGRVEEVRPRLVDK